jgi:hypothetical protein
MLKAERSRVRVPMRSLIFFFSVYVILPAVPWSWASLSLKQKRAAEGLSGGKARPARKADNLTATCESNV